MTTSLSPALSPTSPVEDARLPAGSVLPLAALPLGTQARIVDVAGDHDDVHWLAAVGIGAGEHVTLLRRAVFGGPLHVRTGAGGEFAVDRSLAAGIRVVPASSP